MNKALRILIPLCLLSCFAILSWAWKRGKEDGAHLEIVSAPVQKQSFSVEIHTVGELEASKSVMISSSIRGDQAKVVYLIPDGMSVQPGDLLVKMDPTPFEEKIAEFKAKLDEHTAALEGYQKALDWEINQSKMEEKMNALEIESAELELNKVIYGDGPQETARLKAAMQKALIEYEELSGYSEDLIELERQGFLNPVEVKQAEKKLIEAKDAYESAKLQYDNFIENINPMQIKKMETQLKRGRVKAEDGIKTSMYKVGKASLSLVQAEQAVANIKHQLVGAERELSLSEIKTQTAGMVVHKEEYRSGQMRRPRIGDILVKNQALMELPDLNSLVVKSKVREIDLFKVGVGKSATIIVDAYPNLVFTGKVISIGILAMADQLRSADDKFFEIRINLEKGDSKLRPGMTARVVIHADQVKDALTIPIHAVFEQNKEKMCYVLTKDGIAPRIIKTGLSNDHLIAVVSGLKEGESVCLSRPQQD